MFSRPYDIILIGGGLTGSIITLLFSAYRPDVHVLLIEASESCGGGTLETALWDEIPEKVRPVIAGAIVKEWDHCYCAFPSGSERRDVRVIMIDPTQLHLEVLHRINPENLRLNSVVQSVPGKAVAHSTGSDIGKVVIDARESQTLHSLNIRMKSRHADFEIAHGLDVPVLADMSLESSMWAFQQYFPVDTTKMLIRHFGENELSPADREVACEQWKVEDTHRATSSPISVDGYSALPLLELIPSRLKLATQIGNALVESSSFEKRVVAHIFQHWQSVSNSRCEKLFKTVRDLRPSV